MKVLFDFALLSVPLSWYKWHHKHPRRKLKFTIFNLTMAAGLYLITFVRRPSNLVNILNTKYCFHLQIWYCLRSTNDNNNCKNNGHPVKDEIRTESGLFLRVSLHFTTSYPSAQARILRSNSWFLPLPHPHIQLVSWALPPKQISNGWQLSSP